MTYLYAILLVLAAYLIVAVVVFVHLRGQPWVSTLPIAVWMALAWPYMLWRRLQKGGR